MERKSSSSFNQFSSLTQEDGITIIMGSSSGCKSEVEKKPNIMGNLSPFRMQNLNTLFTIFRAFLVEFLTDRPCAKFPWEGLFFLDDHHLVGERCESFTFRSCSDFTASSYGFLSDTDSDHSYIEIELSNSSTATVEEELLELRISISSTVPLSKLGAAAYHEPCPIQKQSLVKFPALHRWLGTVLSSLKLSSEETISDLYHKEQNSSELHKSRKAWRMMMIRTAKIKETRVMKFLFFKFRAIQIPAVLVSLVKSRQALSPDKGWDSTKPEERRIQETLRFHHHKLAKRKQMMMVDKKTKSCPGSIKSSPIHGCIPNESSSKNHARERSIQAAIAHCKKSFGATMHVACP